MVPRSDSRLVRLGLALVRPRSALAVAARREHAGRSGTDLLVAFAALVAATALAGVVAAVWLGAVIEPMLGVRGVVHVLTDALTLGFAVLVVAAAVLWMASPRRERDAGRAFDLAAVAVVPLVALGLSARVALGIAEVSPTPVLTSAVTAAALAWTGALVALAAVELRRGSPAAQAPGELGLARRAGWLLAAIVLAGVVQQGVWIARNLDVLRPLLAGEPAPPLSLPRIGARGELGERIGLARGKPAVIDFWATWCKPCLAALPELAAFAKRHPEVDVLAVDLDDPAAARALFEARGYPIDLVMDDGEVSARYGVTVIPHTVVIDASGTVRAVARGGGLDLDRAVR
jgi:thiol-disulfide isomerase/thioredoxin